MYRVNLFLSLLWLLGALMLFAQESFLGARAYRIRLGDNNYSAAWVMLCLAAFNFLRWGTDHRRWVGLFVGVVCLLCAVAILTYEWFTGVAMLSIRFGQIRVSLGWLVMVLAVYNLLRWWSSRAHWSKQRALAFARTNREWEKRRRPTESSRPPDPNFNFTDEPPPPSNRDITDRPPSSN